MEAGRGLYIVGYLCTSLRMGKDHKGHDERNTMDRDHSDDL